MRRALSWAGLLLALGASGWAGEPPAVGGRLRGVVLREGKPAKARVEISLERTAAEVFERRGPGALGPEGRDLRELARRRASPVATLETTEDGVFEAPGLALGSYVVVARAQDGTGAEDGFAVTVDGERAHLRLELRARGGTLRGRVARADGSPWVGGVFVTAWGDPPFHFTEAVGSFFPLDEQGRFRATGLPPGPALVCAFDEAGEQLAGTRPARVPTEAEYLLEAPGGSEVSGRVVADADGTPVAGAEVVGTSIGFTPATTRFRTSTGSDGRFRVRVPVPGWIGARAAGFTPAAAPRNDDEAVELRLVRTWRVRGRVSTSEGRPVAGLRVTASTPLGDVGRTGRDAERSTRTDAEGRFDLSHLDAGPYHVFADGEGWVPAPPVPRVVLKAAEDRVVDLTVMRGARVVGTLTDPAGAPVPGVRVHAWPRRPPREDEAALPLAAPEHAVTDSQGRFTIESLVPGVKYEVSARPSDAPEPSRRRVVPAIGEDRRVDLQLPPSRWVDVTVVDAESGVPVPFAEVHLFSRASEEPEEDEEDRPFRIVTSTDQAGGTTDPQGRVRLGPVGPGSIDATAWADGYSRSDGITPVTEATPSGDPAVTLRLRRAQEVSGRILLPDGSPASGADVSLEPLEHGSSWRRHHVLAGADGSFRSEGLSPGRYRLRASRRGKVEYAGSALVSSGETVVVRLESGPGPDRILVRVLDPDGRPVPSADGHFHSAHSGRSFHVEEGRAEIDLSDEESPEERAGWLEVSRARGRDDEGLPLGRAGRTGVAAGQVVEIRMSPERTIEGRVVGPDGEGVPDARVRADPIGPGEDWPVHDEPWLWKNAEHVRTDASGAFRIGSLGEGRHRLFVSPPAGFVAPEPIVVEAGARDVERRVEAGLTVSLTVTDGEGHPLAGARVIVGRQSDDDRLQVANLFTDYPSGAVFTTDAEGRVHVPALEPSAKYVLGVRAPKTRADLADLVRRDWSPEDGTVSLSPGLEVSGEVRDADGARVSEAYVSCETADGVSLPFTTRGDGTFRFERLPEGFVRLDARTLAESKGGRRRAVRLVRAGAEDVVLELRPWTR